MTVDELKAWAAEVGRTYSDIALILFMGLPETRAGADEAAICLVMKDGEKLPWFAEGKGIEGLAYAGVPGRGAAERILADPRLQLPRLQIYMNFCDVRGLMFSYRNGEERLAGEEIADVRFRVLYPERDRVPPLEEFFHLWGDRMDSWDGLCHGRA